MSALFISALLCATSVVNGIQTGPGSSVKASPPMITSHFTEGVYYFHDSNVTLPCKATGVPQPRYKWFYNGKAIEASQKLYNPLSGMLFIVKPTWHNKGYYHCLAYNKYGTAITRSVFVNKADNYAWRQEDEKQEVVVEHNYKILECRNKPRSVPQPQYSWHIDQKTEVPRTKRITLDQKGNLHLINVKDADSSAALGNKNYFCSSYNNKLNTRTYGSETKLVVHKGPRKNRPPVIKFSTASGLRVPMNSEVELQCIADGVPIPSIIWKRDGKVLETDSRRTIRDFTRSLILHSVKESDQGMYECLTSGSPPDRREIVIKVISPPIWINRPMSTTVVEGSDVNLRCSARSANNDGFVSVRWFRDGEPLKDGSNGKLMVKGARLSMLNVRKPYDIMTLQCNTSNKYGYRLTNTAINVIRKTAVTTNMVDDLLLKKGNTVEMQVSAVPDPLYLYDMKFEWRQGNILITNKDTSKPIFISGTSLYVVSTNDTSEEQFQALMGNYTCTIDIGVPSAVVVTWMNLYTENPVLPSVVRNAGFPLWIVGLICGAVLLIVIIIVIVFFMYRNRGNVWRVEEKERKAGRDVEKELEQCVFPTLSRASHIPEEFKYPPDAAEQAAMSDLDNQQLIHDNESNNFVEQELNIFDEDGSFIGEYDQSRRPSKNEPLQYDAGRGSVHESGRDSVNESGRDPKHESGHDSVHEPGRGSVHESGRGSVHEMEVAERDTSIVV